MPFTINTNIASLQAQNYLRVSNDFQSKTINRVTSGQRIINSGDDASGLAIANAYRSDEALLTQGVRNANDGLSQLQTVDGGISNISQLLDRARTLASQSATDTFTGDRSVANAEFKSVIGEIDRQAQSIGLNKGGAFAKSLNVLIGGGKASNGISATSNGSVSIDLSNSSVDSQSLGLRGVQATNASGVDLSSGQATSVQAIVQDSNNAVTNNTTTFYFSGAGFSNGNRVAVGVNLAGVTDTNSLVTAFNQAIANAGNTSTAAATAFKNAGVSATIYTDSNNKQHLAFTSSSSAFQVEAGDKLANALLGNTTSSSSPDGAAISTTVTGGVNASSAALSAQATVRFQGGGLDSPVDITLAAGKTITDLQTAIAGNTALANAGITLTTAANGSPLTFTSSRGEKFSVESAGDTSNVLGLGTFNYGASNAVDYSTLQAANTYTTGGPTSSGQAVLEFSINGAASNATAASTTGSAISGGTAATNGGGNTLTLRLDGQSVTVNFANDVNKGASETGANIAAFINESVRTSLGLGANTTVASFASNKLTISSPTTGANSNVTVVQNAFSDSLGLTSGSNVSASGTGLDAVAINLAGGTATAGSVTSSSTPTTYDTSTAGTNLTFSVDGHSVALDLHNDANQGATESIANIASYLNSQAQAQLNTKATIVSVVGGNLQISSPTTGYDSTVSITQNAVSDALGLTTGANVTNHGSAPTGQDIANRLNTAFAASSDLSAAGLKATFDNSSNKFTIGSTNGTYFQLDAHGAAGADLGFGVGGTAFAGNTSAASSFSAEESGGAYQTGAIGFTALTNGKDSQTLTITTNDSSGNQQSQSIVLQNSSTTGVRSGASIDSAIAAINSALQKSNIASLQNIVAVKDTSSGDKINLVSTHAFGFASGTSASGNGVQSQGTNTAASVVGTGSSVDISNVSTATNAVTAIANATATLGSAQAVVGRGENQFNYAINLAQSQLTNLAAAESRIRDADLASESANLTKSQILLQAGIAALAQANSAPQQVLSLLKG